MNPYSSRARRILLTAAASLPGDVPIAVEIVSGGSSLLVIHEW